MTSIKLYILLTLFVFSATAQAKIVQYYDENGKPITCEIDSGSLEFIEGLCPGSPRQPFVGSHGFSASESQFLYKQAYDEYGNPNGCWKENVSPKVPFLYVGEVCPENELYFDKFSCVTAANDEIEVYFHHSRITEAYVYGFGGVFFNRAVNIQGIQFPEGLEVLNFEAKATEVEKLEFLYFDHIKLLNSPNFIQGTIKDSGEVFLTEISCIKNY